MIKLEKKWKTEKFRKTGGNPRKHSKTNFFWIKSLEVPLSKVKNNVFVVV